MRTLGYFIVGAALKIESGLDVMFYLIVHVLSTIVHWLANRTPDGQVVDHWVLRARTISGKRIHRVLLRNRELLWGVQRNHILANDWQGTANAANQATAFRLW